MARSTLIALHLPRTLKHGILALLAHARNVVFAQAQRGTDAHSYIAGRAGHTGVGIHRFPCGLAH